MNLLPLIIIGGALAVTSAGFYYQKLKLRKRSDALESVAQMLGLTFSRVGETASLNKLPGSYLLSLGHSHEQTNLMRGVRNNTSFEFFDYLYVTGYGKNSQRWRQSVIAVYRKGTFPTTFYLCPENRLHKILSAFGYQDIDFENRPQFSARYLLRGGNEEQVRGIFTDEILSYFESDGVHCCVEGAGNCLIVYEHSVRVEPDALGSFLDQSLRVLSLFEAV